MPTEGSVHDVAFALSELRTAAASQTAVAARLLEEMHVISQRLIASSETGATFLEYRKTLHERFEKIHGQINDLDQSSEQLNSRVVVLENMVAGFRANWKLVVGVGYALTAVLSALAAHFQGSIIKAFLH